MSRMKVRCFFQVFNMKDSEKIKIHTSTDSDLPGLLGLSEQILRKFKSSAFFLALIPIFFLYIVCLAIALYPGVVILQSLPHYVAELPPSINAAIYALALALSYLLFAFSLVFVVPIVNYLLPLKLKASRGNWYSLQVIPWYYHNALTQLVRYSVLDILTPTPFNMLFFKMMGMKIGKNCIVNTTNISDPCLIELGDYVTIGGSATLFAHYGQGGYLIIGKTKIGDYSTVGLKASIMGSVNIGKHCMIGPHVAILPKTKLEDGTTVHITSSESIEQQIDG